MAVHIDKDVHAVGVDGEGHLSIAEVVEVPEDVRLPLYPCPRR
jgi:hypothetical protein